MSRLAVVCWKWGAKFGPEYVNRLRSMVARNLALAHDFYCVTDDVAGLDPAVRCVTPPELRAIDTFRCRRRLWQYARERADLFGARMLALDVDLVITRDITDLIDRPEPVVMVRIGYAGVYSGSFVLCDVGALHGAFERFERAPEAFIAATGLKNASDQAMLNLHLHGKQVAQWTEADGFVVYFGHGYKRFEHLGVGPNRPHLPPHARVVILGGDDKHVMDAGAFAWVREHWL